MNPSELLERRGIVIPLLLVVGLLRFVNLGFGEIQEWDEALYAVRAKSIIHFGDWLDQTEHAVGGLYSAAHPPVFIWLTALTYKAFGVSNFSTRLWSAVFGCGLVFVVYFLGGRLYGRAAGFFAAVLLGTIPLFTLYCRLGQLDVAYLFFFVTSLYLLLLHVESGRTTALILSGISFGLSLSSKSLVGVLCLPVAFFLGVLAPTPARMRTVKTWKLLLTYAAIGLLVALPWYVYIEFQQRPEFGGGFLFSHLLRGVQSLAAGLGTNVKELGYFYFVNQLIVRFPLSVLAFGSGLLLLRGIIVKRESSGPDRFDIFLALWFGVVFLVFTLVRTKVVSYTLPMLIPLSLMAGQAIIRLQSNGLGRKESFVVILVTGLAGLWSLSDDFRVAMKESVKSITSGVTFFGSWFTAAGLVIVLVLLVVGLLVVWSSNQRKRFFLMWFAPAVVAVSLGVQLYRVIFIDEADFVDGASELGAIVNSTSYTGIYYVHTPHYTGGMNPQLAFYLNGVNCGWQKEKYFREINRGEIDSIRSIEPTTDDERSFIIIEKNHLDTPAKSTELEQVEAILRGTFTKLLETKRYILYGKA